MRRHDALRDALCDELDRAGPAPVIREQVVPHARPADENGLPRLDLVTQTETGRPVYIDVAVVHALGRRPMASLAAARRCGEASRIAETYKRSAYPGIAVTPAILEVHGRPGPAFVQLIRSATAHLEPGLRSSAVRKIWSRLAVVLQTHNALMILAG